MELGTELVRVGTLRPALDEPAPAQDAACPAAGATAASAASCYDWLPLVPPPQPPSQCAPAPLPVADASACSAAIEAWQGLAGGPAPAAPAAPAASAQYAASPPAPPPRALPPLLAQLSNGRVHAVDFVIYATGVAPACAVLGAEHARDPEDGGVLVDERMRTSSPCGRVFAAGDVATVRWPAAGADCGGRWFQMRLWSQARVAAGYAAHCLLGLADDLRCGFNFDLFAHVTRFFGFKVVLLGAFNGQGLGDTYERALKTRVITSAGVALGGPAAAAAAAGAPPEPRSPDAAAADPAAGVKVLVRVTPGHEYVKVVLLGGRVQGALLIGESDLEETFENLMLTQLDVGAFADSLLDPDVDIEDFFD